RDEDKVKEYAGAAGLGAYASAGTQGALAGGGVELSTAQTDAGLGGDGCTQALKYASEAHAHLVQAALEGGVGCLDGGKATSGRRGQMEGQVVGEASHSDALLQAGNHFCWVGDVFGQKGDGGGAASAVATGWVAWSVVVVEGDAGAQVSDSAATLGAI